MHNTEKEMKAIREFIEFAKSTVRKGVGIEQDFGDFLVGYDGYWTRYKIKDHITKCVVPEDRQIDVLPECARHCWKLLMFRKKPGDVNKTADFLLPLLKEGEIKSFKHNGERNIKTKLDYVMVIYTWGVEERDTLKAKLHSLGFQNIPYRRGCKSFEKILVLGKLGSKRKLRRRAQNGTVNL